MENTVENKAKFMSAHMYCANIYIEFENSPQHNYGRRLTPTVLGHVEFGRQIFFGGTYPSIERAYLILKPLSSISDYEAIETAKIVCPEMFQFACNDPIQIERQSEWLTVWRRRNIHSVDIDFLGYTTCQNEDIEYKRNSVGTTHAVDYLRSKGYALPYNGLSVEELVNRGWVKLKGETKK